MTPGDEGCQLIPPNMDSPTPQMLKCVNEIAKAQSAVPAPCQPAETCTTGVTKVTKSTQRAALLRKNRKLDPQAAAAEAMSTIDSELKKSTQRRSLFQQGRRLYGKAAPQETSLKTGDTEHTVNATANVAPGQRGTPSRLRLKRSLLNKDSPLRKPFGLRKDGEVPSSQPAETDEMRHEDAELRPKTDGHLGEPSGRPPVESELDTTSSAAWGNNKKVGGDPTRANSTSLKSNPTNSNGCTKPEWSPAYAHFNNPSQVGGGGRFGFWSQRSRSSNSALSNNKPKLVARLSQKPPIAPTQKMLDPPPKHQPKTREQDPPAAVQGRALTELEYALNERSRTAVTAKASNLHRTDFDRTRSMPETITFKRKGSSPKSRLETKLKNLDLEKSAGKDDGKAIARRVEEESHKSAAPSMGSNSIFESFEIAPSGGNGVGMLDVRHTLQHKRKKSMPRSLPVKSIPEDPTESAYSRFGLEVT